MNDLKFYLIDKTEYGLWKRLVPDVSLSVFQTLSWGEYRHKAEGLSSRYCSLQKRSGEVLAYARIEVLRLPIIKCIYLIQHGPVFKSSIQERVVAEIFFQNIIEIARKEGVAFIKVMIDPCAGGNEWTGLFKKLGFKETRFPTLKKVYDSTILLDLCKTEESIFKQMATRCRTAIRKAEKSELYFDSSNSRVSFEEFYQMLYYTANKAGFTLPDKISHRFFWKLVSSREEGRVYVVRYRNEPLAGALITWFGERAIYLHGGSYDKERKRNASHYLHWNIIKDLKKRGIKKYDLGGVNRLVTKDGPGWGIYLFKSGFGGQKIDGLIAMDKIIFPFKYFLIKTLYNLRKTIKKEGLARV